ncbi:MAG: 1-deoxy-D-xylulose-5-phosphate reductoisomerase [Chloroflexi bacterium]|nr:1-deoxy-D-xylulose-5-phosphate reductoisomerase [Chloroflexota bacterium]
MKGLPGFPRRLVILGSTGSIGKQALEIIERFPDRFRVIALAAGTDVEGLAEQIRKFRPQYAAIGDPERAEELRAALGDFPCETGGGYSAVCELACLPDADMVLTALVGVSGLLPTLKAIDAGKPVALANKETLVAGGGIVMDKAKEKGVPIIPVDSEHSAIFQCLQGQAPEGLSRIILTSSGGPFRNLSKEELAGVTVERTLAHPTWKMGPKVTVDSATLMNKGFEVIEAYRLFGVPLSKIQVVVHPQSIVHSLVEMVDGSVLAQLASPDMRLPIQYALGYPERLPHNWAPLDLVKAGRLEFMEPDIEKFPCLALAYRAQEAGGDAPAALSAADEIAVDLFLSGKLRFGDIPKLIEKVLNSHTVKMDPALSDILEADAWARDQAKKFGQEFTWPG